MIDSITIASKPLDWLLGTEICVCGCERGWHTTLIPIDSAVGHGPCLCRKCPKFTLKETREYMV